MKGESEYLNCFHFNYCDRMFSVCVKSDFNNKLFNSINVEQI